MTRLIVQALEAPAGLTRARRRGETPAAGETPMPPRFRARPSVVEQATSSGDAAKNRQKPCLPLTEQPRLQRLYNSKGPWPYDVPACVSLEPEFCSSTDTGRILVTVLGRRASTRA
jgi:hypothetical protein